MFILVEVNATVAIFEEVDILFLDFQYNFFTL